MALIGLIGQGFILIHLIRFYLQVRDFIKYYVFYKKVKSVLAIQRHIPSPVNHLRWGFLQKQLTALNR